MRNRRRRYGRERAGGRPGIQRTHSKLDEGVTTLGEKHKSIMT